MKAIADWALKASGLYNTPEPGDLFLLWHQDLGRYAHVGFVDGVLAGAQFATLEGNTNPGGSRDGYGVFRRERAAVGKTAFVRWIEEITL